MLCNKFSRKSNLKNLEGLLILADKKYPFKEEGELIMIMTRYGSAVIEGQKKYFPVVQREFAKKTGELLPNKTINTLEGLAKVSDCMPKGLTSDVFKAAQETALKAEANGASLLAKFKKQVGNSIAGLTNPFKK